MLKSAILRAKCSLDHGRFSKAKLEDAFPDSRGYRRNFHRLRLDRTRTVAHGEGLLHPGRSFAIHRGSGCAHRMHWGDRPATRDHRGHQHSSGTQRRPGGVRYHRRVRGHHRDWTAGPASALRPCVSTHTSAGGTRNEVRRARARELRWRSPATALAGRTCGCWHAMSMPVARNRLRSRRCSPLPIPDNERAIGRVLEELGLPLSLSHLMLPEFREYERASTVVVNAYLQPVMQSYLQRLDTRMRQRGWEGAKASRVFVMQSSGGITSLESACAPAGANGSVRPGRRSGRGCGDGQAQRFRAGDHIRHGRNLNRRRPGEWRAQAQQRGGGGGLAGARAHARHSHRRRRRRFAGALRRRRSVAGRT